MASLSISVKDVNLTYGKFTLSNISFSLKSGDILGLIGRSGSGKSTIIKAILGLKNPNLGSIDFFIDGKKAHLNNYVGYSPQQNALYPFLTIQENIRIFGRLNKVPYHDIDTRMNYLLDKLNLKSHKHKRINDLSGGMQKRVDIAATMIHSPQVIVLDEPFNGIDISLQRYLWGFFKELAGQGRIIIISSHMLTDIQKNCNQFGLVENGTYYTTEQISDAVRKSREQNFEVFLENLFSTAYTKGNA